MFKKIIVIFAIVALDQLTKYWAVMDAPCFVLPVLNFVMAPNPGITFGLFPNICPCIVWIGSVLILFYVIWELLITRIRLEKTAYSFIVGGAIGNLVDRFRLGYVVDFLDFHLGQFHYPWPFNVADSFIVLGILLIIFSHFFTAKKKHVHV